MILSYLFGCAYKFEPRVELSANVCIFFRYVLLSMLLDVVLNKE